MNIRRSRRRGSEAIEFALTLPWFLLFLSAIMDFSWYFFTSWRLSAALREAARIGAITSSGAGSDNVVAAEQEATTRAEDDYGLVFTATPTGVVVDDPAGSGLRRSLELSASVEVPKLIGLVPLPPTLTSVVVIRLEDQETDVTN